MNAESRQRIADSIETALRIGDGAVIVSREERDEPTGLAAWRDTVYSEKHACSLHPHCALEELEPRLFSFNSPFGACPACDGLGTVLEFDETSVLPDDSLSLSEGAIEVWAKAGPVRAWFSRRLKKF